MSDTSVTGLRERFRALHRDGLFWMPNPWDVGSARVLESLGFAALATTSSGYAATLGRSDQRITRDELLGHVEAVSGHVSVPVSVDAEDGYADDPAGVTETFTLVADTPAAGCSIEDYDAATGTIRPLDEAVERVGAAGEVTRRHGLVLTARAENHLYGHDDLDDTIARLRAYRDAGADVVYAPGLDDLTRIERLVAAVRVPVNVLALRHGPPAGELAGAGVRRVSTGGSLAWAAYGALRAAADELREAGTSTYLDAALSAPERREVFRG